MKVSLDTYNYVVDASIVLEAETDWERLALERFARTRIFKDMKYNKLEHHNGYLALNFDVEDKVESR